MGRLRLGVAFEMFLCHLTQALVRIIRRNAAEQHDVVLIDFDEALEGELLDLKFVGVGDDVLEERIVLY